MQKFHHLLGCHTVDFNSPLFSFSSSLLFLELPRPAKSLTILLYIDKKAVLNREKLIRIVIKITVFF